MGLVVFSDLDGTLLDHHTYAHQAACPALKALRRRGAQLVLCSSKTWAEMRPLWQELGLDGPLIAENGGGVFLPATHALAGLPGWQEAWPRWLVHPLGLEINQVRARLSHLLETFGARGFGQLTARQVAQLTGLAPEQAELALDRQFDEPVVLDQPQDAPAFLEAAGQSGLEATQGGRFLHVFSGGGKGRAVRFLTSLYRQLDPGLVTVALGDAPNDEPMLAAVDHPVLVAKPDGGHAPLDLPGLARQALPGPQGFNQAVLELLERLP